jgi:ATP adenylyltransferase
MGYFFAIVSRLGNFMADQLWAPWRYQYAVEGAGSSEAKLSECFICHAQLLPAESDQKNLVIARSQHSIAILNRFPYNNGHILVSPTRHCGQFQELTSEELLDGTQLLQRLCTVLEKTMNCHGFNIGLNLGKAAGAGVPGHLHWHIVPRWAGDANYLAVCADTRVIVQSLESAWELLTRALKEDVV